MNPHPIAASISAAESALAARLPKRFPPDAGIEGSMRQSNRHGPLGPRSGAEFACRSLRPEGLRPAVQRRLTGLIHAAKRVRHRSNLMGRFNGRDMAVYTEVSDDALRAFLALYDIGEVTSFKGIAEGVENSNYPAAHHQRPAYPHPLRETGESRGFAVLHRSDGAFGGTRRHLSSTRPQSRRLGARRTRRAPGDDCHVP